MAKDILYASFMIRLWCEPVGEASDRQTLVWVGEIGHRTAVFWQFQSLEHLLQLLAAQLADQAP